MNVKSFVSSGITGFVVYFLMGWLCYGILFTEIYPKEEENANTLAFIALGCLFYAFLYAFIFTKWAGIRTFSSGLKAGFVLGLLYALSMNFFMYSSRELHAPHFVTSMLIDSISTAIMGGFIGLVHGKTNF